MKKKVLQVIMAVAVMVLMLSFGVSAKGDYLYKHSVPALKAAYEYLDDFYLGKNKEFGLALHYGSPSDIEAIKSTAKSIVKGCKTDEEKLKAICDWVMENITYKYDTSNQFPIDVLVNRDADCMGYAYLTSDMLRSVGITTAPVTGYRGDMVSTVDVDFVKDKDNVGHAAFFAYVNNEWLFCDPLWDFYEEENSPEISKWYFINNIEGSMPYYKGINYSIQGSGNIYKDGRFFVYSEKGLSLNGNFAKSVAGNVVYNFTPTCRYVEEDGGHDGNRYLVNNERQAKMINGECYSDGWITYCDMTYDYMQPNGVSFSNIIVKTGSNYYYYNLKLTGDIREHFFYKGNIVVYDGEKIPLDLMNKKELEERGMSQKYIILTDGKTDKGYGKIKIDNSGRVTVLEDGLVVVNVIAENKKGKEYVGVVVNLFVTKTTDYASCEYDRHIYKTVSETSATVKADGSALKKCVSCGKTLEVKTEGRKKLGKVTGLKVKAVTTSEVRLSWKKVSGAEQYNVYYSTDGKKWKKLTAEKNSVTVKKLKSGSSYRFKVKAVTGKYAGKYSSILKTATKVGKATLKSLKSLKSKQVTLVWTPVSGANGYQLKYSTSKKFTDKTTKSVTVKKQKSKKVTLKKLKKGKKYYVKLRAFKTVNGKKIYGSYSKVKSVKIK